MWISAVDYKKPLHPQTRPYMSSTHLKHPYMRFTPLKPSLHELKSSQAILTWASHLSNHPYISFTYLKPPYMSFTPLKHPYMRVTHFKPSLQELHTSQTILTWASHFSNHLTWVSHISSHPFMSSTTLKPFRYKLHTSQTILTWASHLSNHP